MLGNSTDRAIETADFISQLKKDADTLRKGGFTPEEIAGFLDSNLDPTVKTALLKYLGIKTQELSYNANGNHRKRHHPMYVDIPDSFAFSIIL